MIHRQRMQLCSLSLGGFANIYNLNSIAEMGSISQLMALDRQEATDGQVCSRFLQIPSGL